MCHSKQIQCNAFNSTMIASFLPVILIVNKFSGMLGEDGKKDPRKVLLKNFKERPSKLEKSYSQDLVKQTVGLGSSPRPRF